MALVLARAYLLHPAVGWTNLENFHPDCFLGVLVGMAIWAALERHWRTYVVFVVLVAARQGGRVAGHRARSGSGSPSKRDRRIGLITIVGSLGFMLFAMLRRHALADRRADAQHVADPVRRRRAGSSRPRSGGPAMSIDHLRADERPWYVWQMLTPFAYVFLRRPSVALIGVGRARRQRRVDVLVPVPRPVPLLARGRAGPGARHGLRGGGVRARRSARTRWRQSACSPCTAPTCGVRCRSRGTSSPTGRPTTRWPSRCATSSTRPGRRGGVGVPPRDAAHGPPRRRSTSSPTRSGSCSTVPTSASRARVSTTAPRRSSTSCSRWPRRPTTRPTGRRSGRAFELVEANESWELYRRTGRPLPPLPESSG